MRYITALKKNLFISQVLTLASGSIISAAIPLFISPILARIYNPEEYGQLALFLGMVSILSVIATLRYELAIMLPKKNIEAVNLIGLTVFLTLIFSLIIFILIVLFKNTILQILGAKDLGNIIYLLPITVLFTALNQIYNIWFSRNQKYKLISFTNVFINSTQAGTRICGGIGNIQFGLIWGTLIAQFLGFTIYMHTFCLKTFFIAKRVITIPEIKKQALKYILFPKFEVLSVLINTISVQLPIFMLTKYFSVQICGYYSQANNILTLPIALLGAAVGQVYYQKASTYKEEKTKLKDFTYNIFKKLLLISIAPMMLIGFYGKELFVLILGNQWETSGQYAQYLWVWLLFVFISSPLSYVFSVLGKQRQGLLFNLMILVSRFITIYVGAILLNDSTFTVLLFGIIGAVLWGSYSIYLLKIVGVSYKTSTFFLIKALVPSIILYIILK